MRQERWEVRGERGEGRGKRRERRGERCKGRGEVDLFNGVKRRTGMCDKESVLFCVYFRLRPVLIQART